MSDSELNTLSIVQASRFSADELVPALTILSHPRLALLSSRALVSDRVELGRNGPVFEPLGQGQSSVLDDQFLSRKPVILMPRDGGVEIDPRETRTQVDADGQVLTAATFFDGDRLDRGIAICLAGRVAMLLHRVSRDALSGGERFDLVGHSAAMQRVRQDIVTVARVDIPVLIRGESGTGKELIARAIHLHSRRADRHYEAVNMAAIPATIAGSELFGHVKGAFTGADRPRDGCFVRADQGTLFLDEIGDTPTDIQAQLLRVLETSDIRPLGASSTVNIDVRIISATDANLETAIAGGGFRQALLQRLAGFQINVPPLRERREDIGALFYFFARAELDALDNLQTLGQKDWLADSDNPWVPAPVVARLARYDWPGNVRQLRNIVRQLVIAGRNARTICSLEDLERLLPKQVIENEPVPVKSPADVGAGGEGDASGKSSEGPSPRTAQSSSEPAAKVKYRDPSDVTEDELLAALRTNDYRLAAAAKTLGMSRTSLYAMVGESSRVRKAADLSADEITAALHRAGGKLAMAAKALEVSSHALKLRIRALGISR